MPRGDHVRPPMLAPGELVVRVVDESGVRQRSFDFGQLPGSWPLRRSLAEAFAFQTGPEGTWRSLASGIGNWYVLTVFTRFLADLESPPNEIADIDEATWAAWRLSRTNSSSGHRHVRTIRTLLLWHPQLPAGTRKLMTKRVGAVTSAEIAYTPEEFDRIKLFAGRRFRSALHRIRDNQQLLEQWRSGQLAEDDAQWELAAALDGLSRTGDVPAYIGVGGRIRTRYGQTQMFGGSASVNSWMRLFLNCEEAAALAVLMIATYGWNATSVAELKVPRPTPDPGLDGKLTYRVELEKRRRNPPHRYETRNLTDWGAESPGRLISQAIEATEPARTTLAGLEAPTDRLIVSRTTVRKAAYGGTAGWFQSGFRAAILKQWAEELGLNGGLNCRRLRKTVLVGHLRTPSQHGEDTHERVYVLPDPRTRADAISVIGAGVAEAVESAQLTFTARISKTFDTDPASDTATATCTDYYHSPFGEPGSGCRASFLLCTACPNAVVTPRHLPRLAYLLHTLENLQGVLPDAIWDADWRDHHGRLADLRLRPDFTDTEWSDALAAALPADRSAIDALLNKGFDG